MNRRAFLTRLCGIAIAPLAVAKVMSSVPVRGGWVHGGQAYDPPVFLRSGETVMSKELVKRTQASVLKVITEHNRAGGLLRYR